VSSIEHIFNNMQRLRKLKKLSQKQVAMEIGMDQGQYSRIESGKVEPTLTTLGKIAEVLGVTVAELVQQEKIDQELNLSLLKKIKLLDQLEEEEKQALLKLIDIAISKKTLKDSLARLVVS